MRAVKFEGVDILDSLAQIMELHTQNYKDDFDLDRKLILKLAVSQDLEDKRLLWMSRPCGTYTLRERETYLQGSYENNVWRFYHEQTKDPILAYALQLENIQDGNVTGTLYPLDYAAHVELVKGLTCPIENVTVTFEDGAAIKLPYQSYRRLIDGLVPAHGNPKSMSYEPESERELAVILKRERFKRDYHAVPGDIKEYINGLQRSTMRGKLRKAQTAVATQKTSIHKREQER